MGKPSIAKKSTRQSGCAFRSSVYKFIPLFIIYTLFLIFGIDCRKEELSPKEKISRLLETGKKKEALTEIKNLLEEENIKNSTLLSGFSNPHRIVRRSRLGNTIAWVDGPLLFYWFNERFEKIELNTSALEMNLSHEGKYIVLLEQKNGSNKGCSLTIVSVETKTILPETPPASCNFVPAITDNGLYLFRIYENKLHSDRIDSTDFSGTKAYTIPLSSFKPKYGNLDNRFFLYDLPGDILFILHGTGGYYQGYNSTPDLKSLQPVREGFARPILYGSTFELSLIPKFDSSTQKGENSSAPGKVKEGHKDEELIGQIYYGGAGSLEIYNLIMKKKLLIQKKSNVAHYSPSLVYIENRKAFLTLQKKILTLLSDTGKSTLLPLFCRKFEAFTEGIIFEDSKNRLHLRRTPFSQREYEILQFLEEVRNRGTK